MTSATLPARPALADIAMMLFSGLLTALAMPGMGDAIPGSTWGIYIALIPLLWVTVDASPKRALLLGWLAGSTGFFISMNWVANTVHTYGGLSYWVAYPVALLLAAYLGFYTGLFALGARFLFARRIPLVLAAPILWVALEYLRTHALTGMPWNPLALAATDATRIIQLADVTGIFGVSWYIVTVNVCLFVMIAPLFGRHPGRRQSFFFNHALILLIIPISVAAYGQVQIASLSLKHQNNPNPDGPIRIALVQPNIPQNIKWRPDTLNATLKKMERLTLSSAEFEPDLVVWPEASAPLILARDPEVQHRIGTLARKLNAELLVGTLAPALTGAIYNSVVLIDQNGTQRADAHKVHLVPFGEYVPLESVLPFVRALTDGIGDVLPGTEPLILPSHRGRAALAICYEIIFPNLVRQRLNDADFIVTVTNDAWFGSSPALAQHFAQAVFRAVENRSYVVRAANTGITGMIDPYGIVQHQAKINTEAVLNVAIDRHLGPSLYTTYGDLFAKGSVILSLALLAFAALSGGRNPRRGPLPNDEENDEYDTTTHG